MALKSSRPMEVLIYSPYLLEETAGNAVTAQRLRRQLVEAGYTVTHLSPGDPIPPGDLLIALNAWRSAEVVARFSGPMIVLLTGTDINRPEVGEADWKGRPSMEKAEALVVLQEHARYRVPSEFQSKTSVIFPSAAIPLGLSHQGSGENVCRILLAGRLRPEKQASVILEACHFLPPDAAVRVEWYGAVGEDSAPHFRWRGAVSQDVLWQEMARADAFINCSSEEGGANAVCEAIALGLPVIASRIGGNIGMLGESYEGYFEAGDASELASQIQLASLERLREQVLARQSSFQYETEANSWAKLVEKVLKSA